MGEMHASVPEQADRGRRPSAGGLSAGDIGASADRRAKGLARRSPTSSERTSCGLGYRESSPPFSFLDHSNRPIGYSLELCEAIVEEIGVEVDDANLKIEYVKVTSG